MAESTHLAAIVEKRESAANLMVVFSDIVGYSKRRTLNQKAVIDKFTAILRATTDAIAAKHVAYSQKNNLNFATDVIRIPTGDGAAVAFSFDGLHEVHLDFAVDLLRAVFDHNKAQPCEIYERDLWCNCHDRFDLRVGVATGKTVIFRDMNGNYNAAGNAMNIAARVMGQVDARQLAVSREAYENLVDMAEDAQLAQKFTVLNGVRVKHGLMMDIYQYTPPDAHFLDVNVPRKVAEWEVMKATTKTFQKHSPGGIAFPDLSEMDPSDMIGMVAKLSNVMMEVQAAEQLNRAKLEGLFERASKVVDADVVDDSLGDAPE